MQITYKFLIFFVIVFLSSCASMGSDTREQKQQTILMMKDTALTELFKTKPDVRDQLKAASGYAVFSNVNIHVIFVAAGTGYGLVKDNTTGQYTYMNMVEGGLGLGVGAKDYRIVMVFHTQAALNHFIKRGWAFGGNVDATAKAGAKGVAVQGEAYFGNVTVYTFTESGLALQGTIKGTKFWQDSSLN